MSVTRHGFRNDGSWRVGLVSPPWYPVPPSAYGGTELVVSLLTEGLVDLGTDVTLFASGDSSTAAELDFVYATAPSERIGESSWELAHVLRAVERAEEFDLLHDHSGPLGLALLAGTGKPVIHTVHGPVEGDVALLYTRICRHFPHASLVSISHSQRRAAPHLPWIATVPNAIDMRRFTLGPAKRDEYLLFLGRMSPEKGAARAVEVARAAGRPLLIAAKCREPAERRYFADEVEPHLGNGIEYLGEASLDEKIELLRHAAATLVPIEWEEPFGLVMIESAACGTPVVATRRGSVPEVVVDGVTGVVVEHHREMAEVLDRAIALDPHRMRAEVVSRFDVPRMVEGYLEAYDAMLSGEPHSEKAVAHIDAPRSRAGAPRVARSRSRMTRPLPSALGSVSTPAPIPKPRVFWRRPPG